MTILIYSRQLRSPKASTTRIQWVAAMGLLAAFTAVAFAMKAGDTRGFDTTIVNAFRDPADPSRTIGPGWLAEAVRDVTSLGSYSVLTILVLLAVAYLLVTRRRFEAIYLAAAVTVGTGLSNLFKVAFNRPRPSFPNTPEVFSASFPSGHATMSAVVFLTLGAMLAYHQTGRAPRVLFLTSATFLTVVVGVSRVYLGLHFPTDVIAGWSLGAAWAIACVLIARHFAPPALSGSQFAV